MALVIIYPHHRWPPGLMRPYVSVAGSHEIKVAKSWLQTLVRACRACPRSEQGDEHPDINIQNSRIHQS